MNHFISSALATSLITFTFALFVWRRGTNRRLSQVFSFYSLSISLWSFLVFVHGYAPDLKTATFAAHALHIPAIMIPVLFVHFVHVYLGEANERFHKLWIICSYLVAASFGVLAPYGIYVSDMVPKYGVRHILVPGGGIYFFYMAFFVMNVLVGLLRLFLAYPKAAESKKTQLMILILGSVIGYLGGINNFLIIYDINIHPLHPYGTYLVAVYIFSMVYSIFRHNFMDMETAIKKATIFSGLFIFSYGVVALFLTLGQQYFVELLGLPIWTAMVPTILVITLTLRPLEAWLINVTDRYLFQKKIDWKDFIHQFNREVLTQYDLDKIIESTHRVVETAIRPEKFAIYLVDPREDAYTSRSEQFTEAFGASSKLVEHLSGRKKYLLTEGEGKRGEASEAVVELAQTGAVLAVPMIHGGAMTGFMLFGKKKSDEPYSKDDIEILSDLAIAETNAIVIAKQTGERVSARAAEYLGQLADGLSHQYNNILSAVIRQLEMVSVRLEMESAKAGGSAALDDLNARVKEAVQDADRGTQFAKSVLNHTRPGRVGFDVQDLSAAVEVGVKLVYMKHRDFKTLKLTTEIAKDLPKTWCNITSMQNIFQITVDNAYDAIKMRQEQEPGLKGRIRVAIRHKKLENVIRIEIEDNGVGMKPHILRSVQAQVPHVTTKGSASEKSGFGAGVNFLGKLVAMHQGKLEYNSEHMNGTVAIIELPVLDRPVEVSTAQAKQA